MLRLEDRWVWDSWVADGGDAYHLFFLQAPRALGDPALRHAAATVGHAVSTDLLDWEVLADALAPEPGGWDDLAIWTGSVVRHPDGGWRMFYTAINARGHGLRDQRIGVVTSDDLVTWRRLGEAPVLLIDAGLYATLVEDAAASETWRDPFVVADPAGAGWHMFITARARGGTAKDDGVIARAWSADLETWQVQPPLTLPGAGFGELEVGQVRVVDGRHVLVFSCHPLQQSDARRARYGDHCTWSVTADGLLGPWDLDSAVPFLAEPDLFAAPLVQRRDGSWVLIGFRNLESEGTWAFEILDPVPVHLAGGGLVADPAYVSDRSHRRHRT